MPTALTPAQIASYARGALPNAPTSVLETAVAIALGESGGEYWVVNSARAVGLWQIHLPSHPQYTQAQMQDPAKNAAAMAALSAGGTNWQPWDAFKNGSYKSHLAKAKEGVAQVAGGAQAAAGNIPIPVPGGSITVDPGEVLDTLNPLGWIPGVLDNVGRSLLTLVIASAGLAVAGMGLWRLTGAQQKVERGIALASTAAGAAATGGASLAAPR